MKRKTAMMITAAVFLFVSACASHRYTVVEPMQKGFTDYESFWWIR